MKLEQHILQTIIDYCDKIESDMEFFGDRETFMEDDRYQRAVSFCLFQIGEEVKHLRSAYPDKYDSSYWKKIAGLRDVIGHGYDSIDNELIWAVIDGKTNQLKSICIDILGKAD